MFLRTKHVKRNGRVYTYQYWQKSVRIGKKVKSIHVKVSDGHIPAMEEDKRNEEWLEAYEAAKTTTQVLTPAETVSEFDGSTESPDADVGAKT